MLLVLLAIEGGTIPFLGPLEPVHVVVGLVLIPIVLLKLSTTSYRFARYYLSTPAYRRAGAPHPILRIDGPFVVVANDRRCSPPVWRSRSSAALTRPSTRSTSSASSPGSAR